MTKTLFLVPWVEIEFGWGDRPEGYKVFTNLDECKEQSIKDSETGSYPTGYMGPVRPLYYYEIIHDDEIAKQTFVKDLPKFKSDPIYI